ncbi:MAG: dihydrodipicolinate synthase family protein [Lachnospiraceae bacterium]|nr:dihydrodipicolinate synthase family protein [Lachnospiraceae bacterium]
MKKAMFLTPVVTAFDAEGNLDIPANKRVYEHLMKGGVDGLVVMGSTGEFFAMTTQQKKDLIDLAVETVDHQVKLLIGTSCMTVEDTVELANYAIDKGADAVMIISPYYFTLSDASVEYYYDQVAEQIHGDIYMYNFPARTGHDISPQVTLNLLRKHKNIVGYKDTVFGMDHTRELLQMVKYEFPDFVVLSGFDNNFVYNVMSGGSGCIGGLSNLYPELFAEWRDAVNDRDMEKVAVLQKKVDKLFELYSIGTPFIPIVKKAMIMHGVELQDCCTKPFLPATKEQTAKIQAVMDFVEKM